jgi:mRNA interferase HigB
MPQHLRYPNGNRAESSQLARFGLVPKWDHAILALVRIIAVSTLKAFLGRSAAYGDAHGPMMAWVRVVKAADWAGPAGVKRDIGTASILKDGRAVFNIAGNKYRIVVWINYPYRVLYIRFVGTHAQYDAIDAQTI